MWCVSTYAAPCNVIAQAGMWHALANRSGSRCWIFSSGVTGWCLRAMEPKRIEHWNSLEWSSDATLIFQPCSQALSDASTFLTSSFQVLAKLQSIWAACIEHQLQPNASPWLSWETQAVNFTQNRNRLCGYAHGHNFVLINPLIILVSSTFGCVPQVITLLGIMIN